MGSLAGEGAPLLDWKPCLLRGCHTTVPSLENRKKAASFQHRMKYPMIAVLFKDRSRLVVRM